ncbi:MAG: HAD family hydrolase [Patescibacteria group bacterium]|nr:HAD family hydrolase [Patescibacteria group bacterium]
MLQKNKKYKAIVADLDGTLIDEELKISYSVKNAIKSLQNVNIAFTIATGKSFTGVVEKLCQELHLKDPQITRAGSEIVDPQTGEVIHADFIPNEDLKRLIVFLNKNTLPFWIEKDKYVYTKEGKHLAEYGQIEFKKFSELELKDVPKLGIFGDNNLPNEEELIEELRSRFASLSIIKSFQVTVRYDVTSRKATKQNAIMKVADMLKINKDEIIGIGDGNNDVLLLEACGYKVAMGNATDRLKAIANEVIASCKDDGVAKFIDKLLKLRN